MIERSISALEQTIVAAGDELNLIKLQQLQNKIRLGHVNLVFCGHFSAGKSSLLNRLCAYPLLPVSPIPTSANTVTIRNGNAQVQVTHTSQTLPAEAVQEIITFDQLEQYCKDGAHIKSIEITYPLAFLGTKAQLLDTPGIDSADEAHQLATAAVLHLADVIFYVMDYNHVQSEVNLRTIKQLKDSAKPLYLIINQIDKHREEQLRFADFRKSVEQCFLEWEVQPDGILYITLKQSNKVNNDWDKFVWLIGRLIEQSDLLNKWSIKCSLNQIANDHSHMIRDLYTAKKVSVHLNNVENENYLQLLNVQTEITERLRQNADFPEKQYNQWVGEVKGTIENANLTPAVLRDIAHEYLLSRKPGFKAGLFATAARTAKLIEQRLSVLQHALSEQLDTQLNWHLQNYFKTQLEQLGMLQPPFLSTIEQIGFPLTPQWLANQVNPGAVFTAEYTLNFANKLAAEMKEMVRKKYLEFMQTIRTAVQEQCIEQTERLAAQLKQTEQKIAAHRCLQRLEAEEHEHLASIEALMIMGQRTTELSLPMLESYSQPVSALRDSEIPIHTTTTADSILPTPLARFKASDSEKQTHVNQLQQAGWRLRQAAKLLEKLSSTETLIEPMLKKAKRLENHHFTIALFGAFSAGKSSFANALIGRMLLPVSPNPTTAAINTIMPPTKEYPNGTAVVKLKTKLDLLAELQYSANIAGIYTEDMEKLLLDEFQWEHQHFNASQLPHIAFLQAASRGWVEALPNMGNEIMVDLDGFEAYVADELKSCFVASVKLYCEHLLSSQGFILVDTPGADSIHARHTGVAFNYIKNADAICFVTYYNHAFSQSDREFLLQLGRVKDSFELDKMFFIMNAADLAANAAELEQVKQYFEQKLQSHGIRHPRIYPIASLQAIEGKQSGNNDLLEASGMAKFEQEFVHFTMDELTSVALHSAEQEIVHAATVLQQRIHDAELSEDKRQRKLSQLGQKALQAEECFKRNDLNRMTDELAQETTELLYYVKQRIMFRYAELFHSAFHPSNFRIGDSDERRALKQAWSDLQHRIFYDLSQEVLATTLRMEQFLQRAGRKKIQQLHAEVILSFADFQQLSYAVGNYVTPSLAEDFTIIDMDDKWLLHHYRNGKYFFEGEGKNKLKAELEPKVNELVQQYILKQGNMLKQDYQVQAVRNFQEQQSQMQQSLAEHIKGLKEALELNIPVNQLNDVYLKLQSLTEFDRLSK